MDIESLSGFSLHLVAVGFAAVAEREQIATSDELRERLREKNLHDGGGKERRLENRGAVVIRSGFGRSKDVIVNL